MSLTPDIHIPDEALEAAADQVADVLLCERYCERGNASDVVCQCRSVAFHSGFAMLRAWPWVKEEHRPNITPDGKPITVHTLILHLPQEPRDE